MTKLERQVIEAAKRWANAWRRTSYLGATYDKAQRLFGAVAALNAQQRKKPKRKR